MLEHFRLWLGGLLKEHSIEAVAVEAPAMGAHTDVPTIYRQAMLHGSVAWACHVLQLPRYMVSPARWRKTFIGFGKAPRGEKVDWKRLAVQRARALGLEPPDHNSAEALGVLDHVLSQSLKVMPPWRAPESASAWLPLPEIGSQCQTAIPPSM
jgi:Holliday junction resolvasome RuvABC endonuclease subunit